MSRPPTAAQARRKLRLALSFFALILTTPVLLLVSHSLQQLRSQSFYQYQKDALGVARNIARQFSELLVKEEQRPFDEYSFYSVTTNALTGQQALRFSPLSELPPKTEFPAVVGYFQINPDGKFTTPMLPEIADNTNAGAPDISPQELARRQKLAAELAQRLVALRRSADSRTVLEDVAAKSSTSPTTSLLSKANELRLDTSQYSGKVSKDKADYGIGELFSKVLPQRATRKETLNIAPQQLGQSLELEQAASPDQSTPIGGLSDRPRVAEAPAPAGVSAPERDRLKATEQKKVESTIFSFEGDVDPLQFKVLDSKHGVFYRKVWRAGAQYVQGFVVDSSKLLEALSTTQFRADPISAHASLTVALEGVAIHRIGPQNPIVVALERLPEPLDASELLFTVASLPLGPGSKFIAMLSGSIALVLILGLYTLYRLGLMQIALAEKRSDFVAAVSHELKTPLTSIRMYAEMLRSGWVGDEAKKRSYYDFIFSESERLSRLIANVLQLARLTKSDERLDLKPRSCGELLDLIRSKVSSQVESAGFALEVEPCECPSATLQVDEDSFTRIFINLVDNAVKFSKQAELKKVVLGCRPSARQSGQFIFYVRDFGPGVDPKQSKAIFQLFYRAESELTRSTPGTGIGLALVKELASKMNATVDFTNQQPGVEFGVTFST